MLAACSLADVWACIPKNTAAEAATNISNQMGIKIHLKEVHIKPQNLLAVSISSSSIESLTVSSLLLAMIDYVVDKSLLDFYYTSRLNTVIIACTKSIASHLQTT